MPPLNWLVLERTYPNNCQNKNIQQSIQAAKIMNISVHTTGPSSTSLLNGWTSSCDKVAFIRLVWADWNQFLWNWYQYLRKACHICLNLRHLLHCFIPASGFIDLARYLSVVNPNMFTSTLTMLQWALDKISSEIRPITLDLTELLSS